MFNKEQLKKHLDSLNINPIGTLMVHLSYKSIGEVDGRADTVIDSLMEYMKDGLLVLPGHSWDNVNTENPIMDVRDTKVCVGIVPELFRKRKNVFRSLHPTHSLCAFGKDAEEFVSGDEFALSPCPKNSTYHKLYERKAQILLIGVGFTRNTYIHGIEEWEGVPDTISSTPTDLFVIDSMGKKHHTPQFRHCAPLGSETFGKMEKLAIQKGASYKGKFGDADAIVSDAVRLREVFADVLNIDKRVLFDMEPLDEKYYR